MPYTSSPLTVGPGFCLHAGCALMAVKGHIQKVSSDTPETLVFKALQGVITM